MWRRRCRNFDENGQKLSKISPWLRVEHYKIWTRTVLVFLLAIFGADINDPISETLLCWDAPTNYGYLLRKPVCDLLQRFRCNRCSYYNGFFIQNSYYNGFVLRGFLKNNYYNGFLLQRFQNPKSHTVS